MAAYPRNHALSLLKRLISSSSSSSSPTHHYVFLQGENINIRGSEFYILSCLFPEKHELLLTLSPPSPSSQPTVKNSSSNKPTSPT
jgi:hypothetical protein